MHPKLFLLTRPLFYASELVGYEQFSAQKLLVRREMTQRDKEHVLQLKPLFQPLTPHGTSSKVGSDTSGSTLGSAQGHPWVWYPNPKTYGKSFTTL